MWLVKLAFSKATPFFLLQPTRRTCCSRHLFVPFSSSHLVPSNIFHRIFFNIQIVFFPVHFDSHINAAMNDLYDKIIFSLVLSSALTSWLFRFFLLVVTIVIALRCGALPYHTADLDFKRAGRQRKRLGGRPRSSKRVVVIFQSSSRRRKKERKKERADKESHETAEIATTNNTHVRHDRNQATARHAPYHHQTRLYSPPSSGG